MTEMEELEWKVPLLDAATVRVKPFELQLRATQCGRVAQVVLALLCKILFSAVAVGIINPLLPPVMWRKNELHP